MAGFDLFHPEIAPKGVATLLKTPLLDDGQLDETSFVRQTKHVVDVGTCLAITGMIGSETYALSDAERVRCLELTLDICEGHVPVCAAVVGVSVHEVVAAAERAAEMGADLIAVVPPPWMSNGVDIAICVKAVASVVSLPIMVHSLGGAGVSWSVEGLAKLPMEAPNVLYLKEESLFSWQRVRQLLEQPGGEAYRRIMVGPPLVLGYLAGARLFMSAADLIEGFIAVFDALEAGDLAEARRIDALIGSITFFKRCMRGESSNKFIMHRRGLFASPLRASPSVTGGLKDFTPAEEDELTELLRPLLPYFAKSPPKPPA